MEFQELPGSDPGMYTGLREYFKKTCLFYRLVRRKEGDTR
jgi:hypothetical protein